MTSCPAGHESAVADYCDVCGRRMDRPATPPRAQSDGPGPRHGPTQSASPCPRCGAPGLERFCEACGHAAGPDPVPGAPDLAISPDEPAAGADNPSGCVPVRTWTAVVTASRPHYNAMITADGPGASEIQFPGHCPERRFPLSGPQMRIGRRSISRAIMPEIDLTGPPADPGISHLHAILIAQPDGSWAVVDVASENGTTVNGTGIPAGQPVPLSSGDSICIGAWTAITLLARSISPKPGTAGP